MPADPQLFERLGDELHTALQSRKTVQPLSTRFPSLTLEDAYQVQERFVARMIESGARIIGKKIGVTSQAVQQMLKVYQPDFGMLTDRMAYGQGDDVPLSTRMLQPRAEGEIAFVLRHDLMGPGITNADVLRTTEGVMACFEIVDSRIENWQIGIVDTIADNASCGLFALGDRLVNPAALDLRLCGVVMEKNGRLVATGAGAAALGSPINSIAWLANTLGRLGIPLKAGEIILSGSLVPLIPVEPGDHISLSIGGIGTVAVRFV